jgi:formylglycine-generating enzyme required for sulfatase activity
MMRRADRVQGARFVAAICFLVIAIGAGFFSVQKYRESIATGYVERLLNTTAEGVAPFTELTRPLKSHATPMLLASLEHPQRSSRDRLHAACALAAFGESDFAFPFDSLKDASPGECSNIVRALENAPEAWEIGLSDQIKAAHGKQDWLFKARLAIVALYQGDQGPAQGMLEFVGRPDPIQRTLFIETLPNWYGDIRLLKQRMEQTEHAGLRSGICLGIGSISLDKISPRAKQAWQQLLSDWYQQEQDTGTHSAAGWALQKWGLPRPEIASSPEPTKGRQWYVNSVGITMLRIAEGSFFRRDEDVRNSQMQEVRITRPFFLSDREVSVGVFERFMADEKYPHKKPKDWPGANKRVSPAPDHPVQQVSWNDAVMFCNWLSHEEGLTSCYEARKGTSQSSGEESGDNWELVPGANGYRLPTEAQWEYACRTGAAKAFSHGYDGSLLSRYAVFRAVRTEPCGSKSANAWGLFDMHGNVWEWCQDWGEDYAGTDVVDDPTGAARGSERVIRGGSWISHAEECRAAFRSWFDPSFRHDILGFRLARTVSSSTASR